MFTQRVCDFAYSCVHTYRSPTATQDPAAGTYHGGASRQRLICSPQPGGWLGHHHTGEDGMSRHEEHVVQNI